MQNEDGDRKVNINAINNRRMPVLRELNRRTISIEEVLEAVNELKAGNVPGFHGYLVKCLKN